jgi:hypothetical protein
MVVRDPLAVGRSKHLGSPSRSAPAWIQFIAMTVGRTYLTQSSPPSGVHTVSLAQVELGSSVWPMARGLASTTGILSRGFLSLFLCIASGPSSLSIYLFWCWRWNPMHMRYQ